MILRCKDCGFTWDLQVKGEANAYLYWASKDCCRSCWNARVDGYVEKLLAPPEPVYHPKNVWQRFRKWLVASGSKPERSTPK
jgi:hypothetical protein